MQNFGQFWTTSEFDREYLRNGSRYPKLGDVTHYGNSSCVWWKKSGELWSTNGLELHVSLDPLKCTFWGDYISAHRGCCNLIFLHALEIDQALLEHSPTGTGVPQKCFNYENLKFGLKFSVYTSISSELMGIPSQIFIRTTCREPGVITWVQFLEGLPPKIWEGKKPSKIFRDFWQLSILIANISGRDPQIENRKSSWSTTTPPTLG